jgi:hypothetical protein
MLLTESKTYISNIEYRNDMIPSAYGSLVRTLLPRINYPLNMSAVIFPMLLLNVATKE